MCLLYRGINYKCNETIHKIKGGILSNKVVFITVEVHHERYRKLPRKSPWVI